MANLDAPKLNDLRTVRMPATNSCGSAGSGDSAGDPHLRTLDGLAYDLQAVGEFVLVEAFAGKPLQIQVRQQPEPGSRCANVSYNTAVAARLGGYRVTVDSRRAKPLWIDGAPSDMPAGYLPLGSGDGIFEVSEGHYRLRWADNSLLDIKISNGHLALATLLPDTRLGQVHGLLGRYNGDLSDDLSLRDGTILTQPVKCFDLYDAFAQSWRIAPEESLFDYEIGESTDTFTLAGFPAAEPDMDTIPADLLTAAQQTCEETGVKGKPFVDWCIIDVVCAQDNAAAEPFVESKPSRSMRAEGFVVRDALKASRAPARLITAISGEGDDLYCSGAAEISIFKEKAGTKLGDAIELSVAAPGHYTQAGALIAETLAANTTVDSYYIYRGPSGHRLQGSVTFAAEILGVQVDDTLLKSSDGVLAADETDYVSETRGLDWEGASFELSDDGHTLEVDLRAGDGHQQVRILTEVY